MTQTKTKRKQDASWQQASTIQKTAEYRVDPFYTPNTTAEFNACLKSRLWRLHNLYTIKDKRAELVKFVPNEEQRYLLHNMHSRNVILKVRQLGITTFWLIFMLDSVLFYPGVETGCIAHHREDAQELFENKVKLAYDHLPERIRKMHSQTSDSARKLAFSNGSSIRIGTSFRSGTPVIVLVSEFGKIASRYPEQAREIETGTFNAVPSNGILVVESTAEGNEGAYFDMVQNARRKQAAGEQLTDYDFKFFFFDWVSTSQYTLNPSLITVSQELQDYFDEKEKQNNITIPPEKRAWYAAKSGNKLSQSMKQEYPTDPDEAFEQSIEGAVFHQEMFEIRRQRQILPLKPDKNYMVDTVWDIGYRDATSIIFFQIFSTGRVFIYDYYENSGESLEHYAKILEEKRKKHDIVYGKHYGPHDIAKHDFSTGYSIDDFARTLGIRFTGLPKARHKIDLIEAARRIMSKTYFDKQNTQRLIKCLDHYRWERKQTTGMYGEKPRKDWSSHGADCFQYLAYVYENFGGSLNAMSAERARELKQQYAPPPM